MHEAGWRRERLAVSPQETSNDAVGRVDALIDGYFDFVWQQLRRQGLAPADADDAAQEVFVIAARKIASIEPGHERSFLYGTALRVARNVRRGQRRRREAPEAQPEPHAATPGPDQAVETQQARALLDELLGQLPDELRRVLVLTEIEQLAAPRIAELEGIPVGTVASRLRRARHQFRKLLAVARDRNPFGGAS
jgi:RNA polymerase sigma-70 factor (ECF subfamily)